MSVSSPKNSIDVAADPDLYMSATMQDDEPEMTQTHRNSNVTGPMPSSRRDSLIPDAATAAVPPWLLARVWTHSFGHGPTTTWYSAGDTAKFHKETTH